LVRMRPPLPKRTLVVVLAIVTIGCHAPKRQSETNVGAPATTLARDLPDRVRRDDPVPFEPIPGEPRATQVCGAGSRRPCLLLGWEYYNFAWGYQHLAWFMDTDGNEFEFSFDGHPPRGVRAEDADPVRRALGDQLVTEDDFARIIAASKAIQRRATAVEVRHALALLATVEADQVQQTGFGGCPDGGGQSISGYRFTAGGKGASQLPLEESQCNLITAQNASHAARELAQWVHARRDTSLHRVGPK
jgi:hypothetical protein